LLTWQDFPTDENEIPEFIAQMISEHDLNEAVETARTADLYDHQRNKTINEYVKKIYSSAGVAVQNYVASNNKIASNFFRRLNTQRCTYSLGNGVTFAKNTDAAKAKLGDTFDTEIYRAGYLALIHGVSFVFFNFDHIHVFPLTEFVPLWDENDGTLRAGLRYWRIDSTKPTIAILYTEDGYRRYKSKGGYAKFEKDGEKRSYKQTISKAPADAEPEVVAEENYSRLPIVPLWGSRLHQSTLIGLQQSIDSYDLIRSGFANDLQDCAQIYWILENYGGMKEEELQRFRDQILLQHIAVADTTDGGAIKPYTQDVPYAARTAYLQTIRQDIYEDFGGFDTKAISASNQTATAINSAFQPLDENADDFENQIETCIRSILGLIGIDDVPVFKRNRISNQLEQVQMLMLEATYLDRQTILENLPNIYIDKVPEIMARLDEETEGRFVREESEEKTT
jgi:hypothetical protein